MQDETRKTTLIENVAVSDHAKLHLGDIHNYYPTNDDQCLSDLRITDPQVDKERIEAIKGDLLEDSYSWIRKNAEFKQWKNDDDKPLLWIKGDPGKGKTMLFCGIINELKKNPRNRISFFFCQGTDSRLNNAKAVLRGLTYLLITEQPSLKPHLQQRYSHMGRKLFEGDNAWWELSGMFASILRNRNLGKTFLLIDGLDECSADLSLLLNFITKSHNTPNVKWVVTSRNSPHVKEYMETARRKATLCLELNQSSISASVHNYIQNRVERLVRMKNLQKKTASYVRRYLYEHSSDTFLWVSLVCQALERVDGWDIRAQLKKYPPGLDSIYRIMMGEMDKLSGYHRHCMRLLGIVSIAYRPMTLNEVEVFIDLPRGSSNKLALVKEAVTFCGSFLTLRNDTIYFIHQSAKDFLLNEKCDGMFPSGVRNLHSSIVSRSLIRMTKTLRRDIYGLQHPGFSIHDVEAPVLDPLASIRYSRVYWVDHLKRSHWDHNQIHSRYLHEEIYAFFGKAFLYWFEALSLTHALNDGILAISKLIQLLMSPLALKDRVFKEVRKKLQAVRIDQEQKVFEIRKQALLNLVCDAHLFTLSFRFAIENTPLQTYSVLLFTPVESLIGKLFKDCHPDRVTLTPRRQYWSKSLTSLEGHTSKINFLTFSPDGQHIASASADTTIKIWDMRTYSCLKTFETGSKTTNYLVFSQDGSLLASKSQDQGGVIKIWNVSIGSNELISILRTYRDEYPKADFSFSPDRKYLLLSYRRNTTESFLLSSWTLAIQVWDITVASCHATLELRNGILAATFYPDSQHVLLAICDGSLHIWNTSTNNRRLYKKLETRLASTIREAIFSPCGNMLIIRTSLHSEGEFILWDHKNDSFHKLLLPKQDNYVSAQLDFSPDGRRIIEKRGTELKVFDLKGNKLIQIPTLMEQHGASSVAISPRHCQVLASVGRNMSNTIKVWDLQHDERKQDLDFGGIAEVIISANNRKLALKKVGSTACEIWDVATGQAKTAINICEELIYCWFSSDGRFLGRFLYDHNDDEGKFEHVESFTITVWDAETGCQVGQTIEESSWPESFDFASDNGARVWIKGKNAIRVWDIRSCQCLMTLTFDEEAYFYHYLSPNGRRLAFISANGILQSWDIHDIADTIARRIPNSLRLEFPYALPFAPNKRNLLSRGLIAFTYNCQRLAFVSPDNHIRLLDVKTPHPKSLALSPKTRYEDHNISFSASGRRLVDMSQMAVVIWDAKSGNHITTLDAAATLGCTFSSDDRYVALTFAGQIEIYNLTSSRCHAILDTQVNFSNVSFNEANTALITPIGTFDITCCLAEPWPSKRPLFSLRCYMQNGQKGLYLSPDGVWVMCRGKNLLWIPAEYRQRIRFVGGSTLVLTSEENTMLLTFD